MSGSAESVRIECVRCHTINPNFDNRAAKGWMRDQHSSWFCSKCVKSYQNASGIAYVNAKATVPVDPVQSCVDEKTEPIKSDKTTIVPVALGMPKIPLAVVGEGVEVKASGIPNAGNGLFATRQFLKGQLITEYYGYLIDAKTARDLRTQGKHRYIRSVSFQQTAIDGASDPVKAMGRGGGSFANDARDSKTFTNNAKFFVTNRKVKGMDMKMEPEELRSLDHVYLKALRDIPKGTEIFVSYGKDYWAT